MGTVRDGAGLGPSAGVEEMLSPAGTEVIPGKSTPRRVVTSLPVDRIATRALYEEPCRARGDM